MNIDPIAQNAAREIAKLLGLTLGERDFLLPIITDALNERARAELIVVQADAICCECGCTASFTNICKRLQSLTPKETKE